MLLLGHSSSVCQVDGRWRNSKPECLAPCIVPKVSQGHVFPVDSLSDENITTAFTHTFLPHALFSSEKVMHGITLEVKCDEHYEFPLTIPNLPTCNNGTWSVIPRCVPARCNSLPKPPKHGMVLAPKTDHGMKAIFKCKDGFQLQSSGKTNIRSLKENSFTCSFGVWTGDSPECQEVYCSFPGYVQNGKVLLVGNMGLYDYRPYVKKVKSISG